MCMKDAWRMWQWWKETAAGKWVPSLATQRSVPQDRSGMCWESRKPGLWVEMWEIRFQTNTRRNKHCQRLKLWHCVIDSILPLLGLIFYICEMGDVVFHPTGYCKDKTRIDMQSRALQSTLHRRACTHAVRLCVRWATLASSEHQAWPLFFDQDQRGSSNYQQWALGWTGREAKHPPTTTLLITFFLLVVFCFVFVIIIG